jgi:hypothetical protein
VLADDLVARRVLGVLVDDADRRAELDLLARQFRDVDHLGAGDLVLDLGDLAFDPALTLLGGMILGVFRQVAMRRASEIAAITAGRSMVFKRFSSSSRV